MSPFLAPGSPRPGAPFSGLYRLHLDHELRVTVRHEVDQPLKAVLSVREPDLSRSRQYRGKPVIEFRPGQLIADAIMNAHPKGQMLRGVGPVEDEDNKVDAIYLKTWDEKKFAVSVMRLALEHLVDRECRNQLVSEILTRANVIAPVARH